jgi:hypothetical protein
VHSAAAAFVSFAFLVSPCCALQGALDGEGQSTVTGHEGHFPLHWIHHFNRPSQSSRTPVGRWKILTGTRGPSLKRGGLYHREPRGASRDMFRDLVSSLRDRVRAFACALRGARPRESAPRTSSWPHPGPRSGAPGDVTPDRARVRCLAATPSLRRPRGLRRTGTRLLRVARGSRSPPRSERLPS